MIFVTAMWIIVILAALAVIFAREMRVEVTASGNRVSADQSASIELGAEQYVLAAVDASHGDAVTVLQTPAEQIELQAPGNNQAGSAGGDGYIWIMQAYPDNDTTPAFGITDEGSKLNLNVATSASLAAIPSTQMTQAIADSVVVWRTGTTTGTTGQGADSSYYQSLGRPYGTKNAVFESVDELYLVKDMTDSLLYGSDLDHNGVLDANESANGLASAFNGVEGTGRGIVPFVTVWSQEPNTDITGKARVNIATLENPTQLRATLANYLPAARVGQIIERAMLSRTFRSVFDFAGKTGMQQKELALVIDSLTTSTAKTLPGLVNVNTAPQQVLMCLPGLTSEDAQAIVTRRIANPAASASAAASSVGSASASSTNTDYTWIMSALNPPTKVAAIGSLITGRSYFFSADIVAVSSSGRSFKRARIVVDARSSPPVIVYRKDLTHLGWPLDPTILANLRQNQPLPAPSGYGTGGANGVSQPQ